MMSSSALAQVMARRFWRLTRTEQPYGSVYFVEVRVGDDADGEHIMVDSSDLESACVKALGVVDDCA